MAFQAVNEDGTLKPVPVPKAYAIHPKRKPGRPRKQPPPELTPKVSHSKNTRPIRKQPPPELTPRVSHSKTLFLLLKKFLFCEFYDGGKFGNLFCMVGYDMFHFTAIKVYSHGSTVTATKLSIVNTLIDIL